MKKILQSLLVIAFVSPVVSEAQTRKANPRTAVSNPANSGAAKRAPRTRTSNIKSQLSSALKLAQTGKYSAAAAQLFTLSRRAELKNERPQIKFILGTMLMELKLYQTAAFQFVDVIRTKDPRYSKFAIEKLSVVADILGDDTILNYAISKVNLNDFPANLKDMINYRLGEISLRNGDFPQAIGLYGRVNPQSSYSSQAMFNKGLAELEMNNTTHAVGTFNRIIQMNADKPVTDVNLVAAKMGLARALYQKQDWDGAVEAYSSIPRDTVMWHDAVFEQSWAMLRAARFRSAMSNFQTIHSAYYEDFYIPEALLVRSIVYLYICKYDEMDKVLGLFERTYGPIRSKIGDFIKERNNPEAYYRELEKAKIMKTTEKVQNLRLPYILLRYALDQGDIKRNMNYLGMLNTEKSRIEASASFRGSALGKYALKIIESRSKNSRDLMGDQLKAHLLNIRVELKDLYEQAGFIRYEMINGKKESLKKKISGKDTENQIDDKIDRSFYVENGFEYYPFQGEYWLDEIGNYHYLGKQSCE